MAYFVEFPSRKRPGETVRIACETKQEAENVAFDHRRIGGHDAKVVACNAGTM